MFCKSMMIENKNIAA
ncbi:hypothetical protein [Pantoea rodasii]